MRPKLKYILAVDDSKHTLKEITKVCILFSVYFHKLKVADTLLKNYFYLNFLFCIQSITFIAEDTKKNISLYRVLTF